MEVHKTALNPRLRHQLPLKRTFRRSLAAPPPLFLRGFARIAGRWAQLSHHKAVQPLQIEGHTDQTPLTPCRLFAAQRELAEAQHFLNDADHRLDRAFPQPVDRLPTAVCSL